MREILISIQPKWCELIASGKKTVEVRKTRPKIDTPFKCYIYCTQGRLKDLGVIGNEIYQKRMKVIGEFVCDKIIDIKPFGIDNIREFENQTCLTSDKIVDYLNGFYGYAWHISDLVIYDEPKKLSELYTACKLNCEHCEMWGSVRVNAEEFDMDCKSDWFNHKPLTRPPQSWCYVELLKGGAE